MWKIYKQDMRDIIWGATLLGAGGGGSPEQAFRIAEDIFDNEGIEYVEVVELQELPNNAKVVVSAGMGAPEVSKKSWTREGVFALERLEEVLGEQFPYIIPFEIGAGNFAVPIQTTAIKRGLIVDADGAGRAVPELQMVTYNLYGIPIAPLAIADAKGNSAILYPKDAIIGERMSRALTAELGGSVGFACYIMTGEQVKKAAIPNTITLAREIGEKIREAKDMGRDPVKEVVSFLNAFELARGRIVEITTETKGAFDIGKVVIQGKDSEVRVDYKNENMIVWKDNKPIAMVPDLICWMSDEGTPLTNADLEEGMDVAVIGIPAHEKFRTPEIYNLFVPILNAIGYTGEYIPIEQLNKG